VTINWLKRKDGAFDEPHPKALLSGKQPKEEVLVTPLERDRRTALTKKRLTATIASLEKTRGEPAQNSKNLGGQGMNIIRRSGC